jgi:hypothetical protein
MAEALFGYCHIKSEEQSFWVSHSVVNAENQRSRERQNQEQSEDEEGNYM